MAEQYPSGLTMYQLTEVFGVARQTAGIVLRRCGLNSASSFRFGEYWPVGG